MKKILIISKEKEFIKRIKNKKFENIELLYSDNVEKINEDINTVIFEKNNISDTLMNIKNNIFIGDQNSIIDYINEQTDKYKAIINENQDILLAGEITLGMNHFILNILQPIVLELDIIKPIIEKSKEIKGNFNVIEDSINFMIKTIQSVRELKINYDDDPIEQDVKEETEHYIPLIKDFLNVHCINLDVNIKKELPKIKLPKKILTKIFLESIMYLYHFNSNVPPEKKDKIKISILTMDDYLILNFYREFCCLEKTTKNDYNKLMDSVIELYIDSITKKVQETKGKINIFKDNENVEIDIRIPIKIQKGIL